MANNPHDLETKSLKPEGLEDKSLTPDALEDKAAEPAPKPQAPAAPSAPESDGRVQVIVAHPIPVGRIGNAEALAAGAKTSVSKVLARSLVQQGVARLAD